MVIAAPLPGLLAASFRGIRFFVPEISSEVGRRVAAHYFPGIDFAAYDDHGIAAVSIQLEALYAGSDYITYAKALKQAFETPGPGTLIHPWFGAVNVILTEPAEISFSASELRIVRCSATFEQVKNQAQGGLSHLATVPALIAAGIDLAQTAMVMIDSVNANTLSRLRSDATTRTAGRYFDFWRTLQNTAASTLQAQLPPYVPSTPQSFGNLFSHLSQMLVDMTVDDAGLSAVAPAAGTKSVQPILSSIAAFELTLQLADVLQAGQDDAPSATDQALYVAAIADSLGKAAQIVADIAPTSRRHALTIRQQVTDTLDRFSNSLQSLFGTVFSGYVSEVYRASMNARLRVIADINEIIGRLPQTTIITLERDTDAWLVANMLYGDDPARIEPGYLDLIARNRLRHPALLEAGTLEVLP